MPFDFRIIFFEISDSSAFSVDGRVDIIKGKCLIYIIVLCADLQSTEIFREIKGPKMVMNILNNRKENISILNSGFAVVSAAATGNEVLKEAFMNLKIDELILQCLREFSRGSIPCLYDAVHVLLTSDDNRVVASEVSEHL